MSIQKKGFTLIELLVVISIIGLLSSMAVFALNNARMKARDARRLADMKQIKLALDLYHDDHNEWPEEKSTGGGWERSYEDGGDFIDLLKDEGYMNIVPVDPINNTENYYFYYVYPANTYGCDAKGDSEYYVLGIRNMETSGRPYPSSPNWSCDNGTLSRDWSTVGDWVTGKFE